MKHTYKIGDRITWNYDGGKAFGKIIGIHREGPVDKGHIHHVRMGSARYEIKSLNTEPFAEHTGMVFRKFQANRKMNR